jgi:hypothetical protein
MEKREGHFMVQYLYDNSIVLYTYAGLCGLGLLLRFIVNSVYKHVVKQSEDLGKAKNKMLRYIKMKFEACYRLKIGVNNVDTFVDKNVLRYRFCGLLLSTWENLCGQVLMLNLLLVPVLAVFGVIYDCGQSEVLFLGAVGISSSAILIIVDKSINLSNKKAMFRINLLDYLENFCKVRLEQEANSPELVEQHRREYLQVVDGNKQVSATISNQSKDNSKDELNRRREARRKKEDERKLLAAKREEEQRKAEEARKEEEKRKLEERKQQAAKRREEERLKMEQERQALEARRAELKRKAQELQTGNGLKQKPENEEKPLNQFVEAVKPIEKIEISDLQIKSLEEVAAEKEKTGKIEMVKPQVPNSKAKSNVTTWQEEKLIEDVLKEFFS